MPSGSEHGVWTRVTVECPCQAAEAVSAILLDICPGGLVLEERDDVTRLSGYLCPTPSGCDLPLAQLRRALKNIPAELAPEPLRVATDLVPERDWVEAFKQHCRSVRVGSIVIKPTWRPWPDPALPAQRDDIIIELDPGMAFGTGTHPTTRLCLAALDGLVRPGSRIVDLGCGSGILSIAAARLGAGGIAAVDCDWIAIRATCANAVLNAVADHLRVICADSLLPLSPAWDLVLANITPPVVAREAAAACQLLRCGGAYVCSGIPVERQPEVERALSAAGFAAIEAEALEGWACLTARKR